MTNIQRFIIYCGKTWHTWWIEYLLGLCFLMFLLVGESRWHYQVVMIGVLIIFLVRKKINWSSFVHLKTIWLLSWLWFGAQLISTYHSIHLPASLQALVMPIVSVLWLWVVTGIRRQWLWRQRVMYVASWVLSVFGIAQVMVWFWQPEYVSQFPRLNYLYNNFGHNHISTLMLLVLPHTWMQIIAPSSAKYRLPVWMGVWMMMVLGFAFSRLALIFAVVSLGIFFWQMRQQMSNQVKKTFALVVVSLFLIAIVKQALSASGVERLLCDQQLLTEEYCAAARHELRWWYWEQAWQLFKQSPIWGTGPGTFGYASRAYVQEYGANSAYAHNWILGALAETGLIGLTTLLGLVLMTIVVCIYQRRTKWGIASLLSILFFWTLVLFDFDNQLFVVWSLLLTIVGLSVRQPPLQPVQGLTTTVIRQLWLNRTKLLLQICLTIIVMVYGSIQFFVQRQIMVGATIAPPALVLIAPLSSQRLSKEHITQLLPQLMHWYWHDPDMLWQLAVQADQTKRFELLERVGKLDPWRGVLANQLALSQQRGGKYDEAQSEWYWQFYHSLWLRKTTLSVEAKNLLADNFFALAEQLYLAGEYEKSAQWLVRAQRVEPWILSVRPPFVDDQKTNGQMWVFTKSFISFKRESFGDNQQAYTDYFNAILKEAADEQMRSLDAAVLEMLSASAAEQQSADLRYKQQLTKTSEQLILIATHAYRVLPTEKERAEDMMDMLVASILRTAEYSAGHDTGQIPLLYASALRLQPWAMNGRKWWFQLQQESEQQTQEIIDFLDYWSVWEGDWIGHDPTAFMALVEKGLSESREAKYSIRQRKYQLIQQKLLQQIKLDE